MKTFQKQEPETTIRSEAKDSLERQPIYYAHITTFYS